MNKNTDSPTASPEPALEFALAETSPMGKCSFETKVSLPEEIDTDMQMLASLVGMTKAAYMREVFIEHCIGRAGMHKMAAQRRLRSVR
ncbi:MAG: hypothetical protein V4607_01970 [Pseudomonadota bacterium]